MDPSSRERRWKRVMMKRSRKGGRRGVILGRSGCEGARTEGEGRKKKGDWVAKGRQFEGNKQKENYFPRASAADFEFDDVQFWSSRETSFVESAGGFEESRINFHYALYFKYNFYVYCTNEKLRADLMIISKIYFQSRF